MFARLSPLRFLVALGVLVVKQTLLPTLRKSLGIFLQNAHLVAQEHFTRATTVSSGPNFLAMEVGPLWLFLSYVAVAGFTHLVSTGLHSSHDHKKQAQLPPSTEFMQSTVETAPCGLMDFFNKHKEGPGIDKWAAGWSFQSVFFCWPSIHDFFDFQTCSLKWFQKKTRQKPCNRLGTSKLWVHITGVKWQKSRDIKSESKSAPILPSRL